MQPTLHTHGGLFHRRHEVVLISLSLFSKFKNRKVLFVPKFTLSMAKFSRTRRPRSSLRGMLRKRQSAARRRMTPSRVKSIVKKTVAASDSKYITQSSVLGSTVYTNGSDTNVSVVKIPQGDEASSRVGAKCRVTGIYLKLRMHKQFPTSGQSAPMTLRVRIDEVKQGVTSATTGVSALTFFQRPNYVSLTKKVLMDKTFNFRSPGDGDMQGDYVLFTKFIRLKSHWCRYGTTGAVEPLTGNIIISAYAECPTSDQPLLVESQTRTYFSEV